MSLEFLISNIWSMTNCAVTKSVCKQTRMLAIPQCVQMLALFPFSVMAYFEHDFYRKIIFKICVETLSFTCMCRRFYVIFGPVWCTGYVVGSLHLFVISGRLLSPRAGWGRRSLFNIDSEWKGSVEVGWPS